MNESLPPPLPPSAQLYVLRGRCRQVETESLPNVSGGGFSAAGWGYSRVQTTAVRNQAFWLRTPDGRDCHISVGTLPLPPMLPDHPISVVLCGQAVCAVCNHATGQKEIYRPVQPAGPYRQEPRGCVAQLLGLLLGWSTFFFCVILLHGGLLALIAGAVVYLYCLYLQRTPPSLLQHNQALDRQVFNLLGVPLPGHAQSPHPTR